MREHLHHFFPESGDRYFFALGALQPQQQQDGGGAAEVPFLVGSSKYREAPFYTATLTPGASQQTFTPVPTITQLKVFCSTSFLIIFLAAIVMFVYMK